jgi:hypothetical protein
MSIRDKLKFLILFTFIIYREIDIVTIAGSAYTASPLARNFIVWFGSPGVYDPEDTAHDKAWNSYVNPMLRIAEAGKLDIKKDDTMYWCLYSTGYQKRWEDDQNSKWQFILDHVAVVKNGGSKDYIDHIKKKAADFSSKHGYKIVVKEFSTATDFWADMTSYPDKSVASVWYFGHASIDLWLELGHTEKHEPTLPEKAGANFIDIKDTQVYGKAIKPKFIDPKIPSKFYGCNTMLFAQAWYGFTTMATEGADGTMHYDTWEKDVSKILSTLESGIKNGKSPGKWVKYSQT